MYVYVKFKEDEFYGVYSNLETALDSVRIGYSWTNDEPYKWEGKYSDDSGKMKIIKSLVLT